jgi:hypothetical protein
LLQTKGLEAGDALKPFKIRKKFQPNWQREIERERARVREVLYLMRLSPLEIIERFWLMNEIRVWDTYGKIVTK